MNDNTKNNDNNNNEEQQQPLEVYAKSMTDEECIAAFLKYLEDRVAISVQIIPEDPNTNLLTHQAIRVQCGDYVSVSQPSRLSDVLMIAPSADQKETVQ